MTCGGCVAAVKLQLKRTDGVSAYEVSLEKGEPEVTYDPAKIEPNKIAESVSKTGFKASVKEPDESRRRAPEARNRTSETRTAPRGRFQPWEPVDRDPVVASRALAL
jgi:copper chaperone CopZ